MAILGLLLIFGAALILGDGVITPAISVLSAMEGLEVVHPFFSSKVVLGGMEFKWVVVSLTVIILTGLFSFQKYGTEKVGRAFGPVMILWFTVIGFIGFRQIILAPQILQAVNPYWAYRFLATHGFHSSLLTLGSVTLCITGGEALYADMGHFGASPIRWGWTFAKLALLLNYFGQGALLLSGQTIEGGNIFFSMVPDVRVIQLILVFLAAAATVIASQALISGSYSLSQQAIALGLLPRLTIKHTSKHHRGQIFMPEVNNLLMWACIILVLVFRSSSALAAAYGIAVTSTMLITTVGFYNVATTVMSWKKWYTFALCLYFGLIDAMFMSANLLKFFEGGFVTLLIALYIFQTMVIWQEGRKLLARAYHGFVRMTVGEFLEKREEEMGDHGANEVFMVSAPIRSLQDPIPVSLQIESERFKSAAYRLIFLHVKQTFVPLENGRHEVLCLDPPYGRVVTAVAYFGYNEDPDVRRFLANLKRQGMIHKEAGLWTVIVGKEDLHLESLSARLSLKARFTRWWMRRFKEQLNQARPAHIYYGLGEDRHVDYRLIHVMMAEDAELQIEHGSGVPGVSRQITEA
jgi:KUP system potassium uptake protein